MEEYEAEEEEEEVQEGSGMITKLLSARFTVLKTSSGRVTMRPG